MRWVSIRPDRGTHGERQVGELRVVLHMTAVWVGIGALVGVVVGLVAVLLFMAFSHGNDEL